MLDGRTTGEHIDDSQLECEYYNESECKMSDGKKSCNGTEVCPMPGAGKRSHCYVLWQNSTGNPEVKMKGCWLDNDECYDRYDCQGYRIRTNDLVFCCCEGELCNSEFSYNPDSAPNEALPSKGEKPFYSNFGLHKRIQGPFYFQRQLFDPNGMVFFPEPNTTYAAGPMSTTTTIVLYGVIGLAGVFFLLIGVYFFYRRQKGPLFTSLPTDPSMGLANPPSPICRGMRPIQLQEIKARGRFGAVWIALYKNHNVAVKVFPLQDKGSWMTEQEVYQLSQMSHQNILEFIGAEKRGEGLQTEYWLITAYCQNGSLCDFLKGNTVTYSELCHITKSMMAGLAHLHDEIPPLKGEGFKPSIAHRDFKSKNVLLKSDLTACIADFGLALIFYPNRNIGDVHGQVGTRRYMAPEVLEGAINFTRDAFLRIDMYACGLVLWELLTRCSTIEGQVMEYQLPFEEEVGPHPSLEEMQDAVVTRKIRPSIPDSAAPHMGLSILAETIEECWDADGEARISASCVLERILQMMHQPSAPPPPYNSTKPQLEVGIHLQLKFQVEEMQRGNTDP
ncbi:unnamed protein product, partial [Darwinula stevensoni]